MERFAPATLPIGMHWHHFDQPIFPPIITVDTEQTVNIVPNKVVVYLPFENPDFQKEVLAPISDYDFYIYGPGAKFADLGHIHTRPTSRTHFKTELLNTKFIICNTGFELVSEALTLGKRILTRPLARQVEQMSNALALKKLGYAKVVGQLSTDEVRAWLREDTPAISISYPDVAKELVNWLLGKNGSDLQLLSADLWSKVKIAESRDESPKPIAQPDRANA